MKSPLSPAARISLAIALAAFILQWLVLGYLSALASRQMTRIELQSQTQIIRDLAVQLDRALTQGDDLAALAIINSDKKNFPQLQTLMVFDRQGQIKLHSTPGMMGKHTNAPPLTSAGLTLESVKISHRPATRITLPLPDHNTFYLRADFDKTRSQLRLQAFHIRFFLLILLTSAGLGALSLWLLKNYVLINPLKKSLSLANRQTTVHALADLAMTPATLLIIDQENKILAINNRLWEGRDLTADKFLGLHLLQTPLHPSVMQAVQRAAQTPDQPHIATLSLLGQKPTHVITWVCYPPTGAWQIMIGRTS